MKSMVDHCIDSLLLNPRPRDINETKRKEKRKKQINPSTVQPNMWEHKARTRRSEENSRRVNAHGAGRQASAGCERGIEVGARHGEENSLANHVEGDR